MGVPAQDCFPYKLISRIRARSVRAEGLAAASCPDPRGELQLRRELAVQLAIARGIECAPSQIIITSGFSGGLGLTLRVLGLEGRTAWVEDPSFPLTRKGLEIARLQLVPVPVDEQGLDVAQGLNAAPEAALVVVTPGQQAPLGATLMSCLESRGYRTSAVALAVLLHLPAEVADTVIANEARAFGLAPSPLSQWYVVRDSSSQWLAVKCRCSAYAEHP